MTCRTCGRDDGHWIGCDKTPRPVQIEVSESTGALMGICEHEGCERPKWNENAKTKFCTDHRDPRSRGIK